jgi:hypothetical protein
VCFKETGRCYILCVGLSDCFCEVMDSDNIVKSVGATRALENRRIRLSDEEC